MSGAVWVEDQLESAGWSVAVANARKVRDVAPLACKTDKVDARVLAELCRRDLVPAVWVASLEDRAICERLRRRAHLVKLRTSHRNRIFGLLTQFGLRISFTRLRQPGAMELLERRGVPAVWRDSIAEHLDQIDALQQRISPIDHELAPIASSIERRSCCDDPWRRAADQPHLRRARSARSLALHRPAKLVGYAGLAPRVIQSGDRSATGRFRRPVRGRFAGRRSRLPIRPGGPPTRLHEHYRGSRRAPRQEPGEVSVARKLLICAWHMLSRGQPFNPSPSKPPRRTPARFQTA